MRGKILLAAFALALLSAWLARPVAAVAMLTGGDTTMAVGGTVKLYPCFVAGGGHIHNAQWYTVTANNCYRAAGGYIYTSLTDVRVNIYGPSGVDSSGFTIPGGGSFSLVPGCDSILVTNRGTQTTKLTWGFVR